MKAIVTTNYEIKESTIDNAFDFGLMEIINNDTEMYLIGNN